MSWFRPTSRPRNSAGASSEMNTGTMLEAQPTARPRMTRETTMIGTDVEKAASSEPPTNTAEATSRIGRRPNLSDRRPEVMAPMAAPTVREETTMPEVRELRPK